MLNGLGVQDACSICVERIPAFVKTCVRRFSVRMCVRFVFFCKSDFIMCGGVHVEDCINNASVGYTTTYEPYTGTNLTDPYDGDLLEGHDSLWLGSAYALDCSLYVGESIHPMRASHPVLFPWMVAISVLSFPRFFCLLLQYTTQKKVNRRLPKMIVNACSPPRPQHPSFFSSYPFPVPRNW